MCSPPAWPVGSLSALHLLSAQRGLGPLRRPAHMTCGELFRVEGAPRGGCSLHAGGPARLPPSRLALHPPGILHHREHGSLPFPGSCGRPEIRPRKTPQPPRPYKSPRQKVPTSMASRRHRRETDHAGHAARSSIFDHLSPWSCGGHGSRGLLQGHKGLGRPREETPGSTGKLWGKTPVDVGFGPGHLP